jgi:hypothetical protein
MSRIVFVLAVLALVAAVGAPQASAGTTNGHSYNWFRDADGDGIPNGLDEDWIRPMDGTGYQWHGFGVFLSGLFSINCEGGKTYRHQYRHRNGQSETDGDCIRSQDRRRDGSCN